MPPFGPLWVHALACCGFGLSGPVAGGNTAVGVSDFVAHLKLTGFLREELSDPWLGSGPGDDALGTAVQVLMQTIPKAVVEGLRWVTMGESVLRAAIHVTDSDRGLVARSRMTLGSEPSAQDWSSADPTVGPLISGVTESA